MEASSKWNAGWWRSKTAAMARNIPFPCRKIDRFGMARCFQETNASATEASALKICDTRMIRLRLNRSAR